MVLNGTHPHSHPNVSPKPWIKHDWFLLQREKCGGGVQVKNYWFHFYLHKLLTIATFKRKIKNAGLSSSSLDMGQSVRFQCKKTYNFQFSVSLHFFIFLRITCGLCLLQTEGAKRGEWWNQADFNPDSASQPTNIVLLIFIIITIGRNNQTKTLKLYFNTKYVFNLIRALIGQSSP